MCSSITLDVCIDHSWILLLCCEINTLRPRQNGRYFADDIFKYIFLNENVWIPIKISLKFVPKGRINKIPTLIQIMAWRRPGDKPLSETIIVSLPTRICVTRPQWVNAINILGMTSQVPAVECIVQLLHVPHSFHSQKASIAENASMWSHHHVCDIPIIILDIVWGNSVQ